MSMIGKTLGNFECTALLGKGGMGEVYRAKDQKLGRDVAIKVLPEEFARDADRVARFQREAKLLAVLNHPNIAAIHGLEESEGIHFLVLELIDGDTLADRLRRGAIPAEETLKLALQIAEALEAAHEKGVIHRDLKPANIKVTPDGKVKVLDFGLAKAFEGDQGEMILSNSPTLSAAATQQGVILGTAAYMSPEQARGKTVDKRTDIWAFGVVLFEMLAGRSAFSGDDVSQTLARVLERQPDFSALPPNLNSKIMMMLERCLEKDTKNRYHDIGDSRVDIQKVLADPQGVLVEPAAARESRTSLRQMAPWLASAVVLTAVIAGAIIWHLKPVPPPEPRPVMRFSFELPEGRQFINVSTANLAISSDGQNIVYCTTEGLYLHSLGDGASKLIARTDEDPLQPFFSPDGQWVGYFSGDQLRKIAITGGASMPLCPVENFLGASWNTDETIVFGASGGIMQVSANGGIPTLLLKTEFQTVAGPQLLPDGKSALFTNLTPDTPKIAVRSLEPGLYSELLRGQNAHFLRTGHIVYKSENNLLAAAFDLDRPEATGGSVPIIEGVLGPLYAVSDSGTLVYVAGTADTTARERTLVWIDKNGNEESVGAQPKIYEDPSISPDATKLALVVREGVNSDIWVWNIANKTLTRRTFEGRFNLSPVWSHDSKRIAYLSRGRQSEENTSGLYWKAADGGGREELLAYGSQLELSFLPNAWSEDEKIMVGAETTDGAHYDIGIFTAGGESHRTSLLQEDYLEAQPKISPDWRWLAYTSGESHQNEVFVRPFPDVGEGGPWQISTNGGDSPLWSPDGRELFYINGNAVMAVSVKTEPSFSLVEVPHELFRGVYVGYDPSGTAWDISPDGSRFLMIKPPGISSSEGGRPRKINVIVNWIEELKKRVPTQ